MSRPFARIDRLSGSLDNDLRMSVSHISKALNIETGEIHTERILFVPSSGSDTPIIFSNSPVDTISKSLVHPKGHMVVAPHVEIDEEGTVMSVRHQLQEVHHLMSQRETSILRGYCDRCDMAMPFMTHSFRFAYDYSTSEQDQGTQIAGNELKSHRNP